jgi:cell division protein FtsQ
MAKTAPVATLPADIRLMNATAILLGAIGVIALVAVAILWAAHRPIFAVRAIKIDGDLTHNSVLTIRANAAPKLAGNFFTMDLAAGRRAFEAVPWVRQAIVRRVWPNRISVQLEEHRAVALWVNSATADEASDKLVNSYGEVFEANVGDVEDDALPTLRGPEGTSAHMLSMLGRLQPEIGAMDARIEARGAPISTTARKSSSAAAPTTR